jgi:hypothetical protein
MRPDDQCGSIAPFHQCKASVHFEAGHSRGEWLHYRSKCRAARRPFPAHEYDRIRGEMSEREVHKYAERCVDLTNYALTGIPEDKVRCHAHSTNVVEHPELVAWRIKNFAGVVGRENVIAGTDCGFSQSYNIVRCHPSVQWAKLQALAAGAPSHTSGAAICQKRSLQV